MWRVVVEIGELRITGVSYRSASSLELRRGSVCHCLADREAVAPAAPGTVTEAGDDLLKLFGSVRMAVRSGRDHPVAAVLALAAAAIAAGMKGFTVIADWVKDVSPAILADLYLRTGVRPAPAAL